MVSEKQDRINEETDRTFRSLLLPGSGKLGHSEGSIYAQWGFSPHHDSKQPLTQAKGQGLAFFLLYSPLNTYVPNGVQEQSYF